MRKTSSILLGCCLLTALMVTACGGGEQKSELEKIAKAAENMGKAAEEMGKTAEEMATATTGDGEPQPAVSFRVLMEYLPTEFQGLESSEPEGESMTMGNWTYSRASVRFREDRKQADVDIFDYAYIPMLYSSFRMMWGMNYNKESSSGFERTTEIAGFPAIEKWRASNETGEITVLVGDRFIVTAKTSRIGEDATRELLNKINLKSLANEKAENPA